MKLASINSNLSVPASRQVGKKDLGPVGGSREANRGLGNALSQTEELSNGNTGLSESSINSTIMGFNSLNAFSEALGMTSLNKGHRGSLVTDLSRSSRAAQLNQLNKTLAQGA